MRLAEAIPRCELLPRSQREDRKGFEPRARRFQQTDSRSLVKPCPRDKALPAARLAAAMRPLTFAVCSPFGLRRLKNKRGLQVNRMSGDWLTIGSVYLKFLVISF